MLKAIFVTGTAGAGKSSLAGRLRRHYTDAGAFAAVLNLDAGVGSLPYTCDIDVRDHVDLASIMKRYELGPNGALVMANDLVASRIEDVWEQVHSVNPDYLIVDTPGQVELLAYRASGPFICSSLAADEKAAVFLYDAMLVNTAVNYASIALVAESVRLRLALPTVSVLSKSDLAPDMIATVLSWASEPAALEHALRAERGGEERMLAAGVARSLEEGGLGGGMLPVSNATGEGFDALAAALGRMIDRGEEIVD